MILETEDSDNEPEKDSAPESKPDGGSAAKPSTSEKLLAKVGPAWWHRHLEPEERRRVMHDLAISRVEHWAWRFAIMLTLSVFVAVMGLALNSPAVVIGAMLLAPLMQPVLATGASLSMATFGRSFRSFAKVVVATAWCIFVAFALSKIFPEQGLTPEILARTKPDIKDLVVALAAGAAGAYATVREDASSSLPGVAVAVALVPPIASVGIALEAGEPGYAWGAFLLYSTNLAAIIFASIAVFVTTGFVPPRRLANNLKGLGLTVVAMTALVAAITYPLYQASASLIESNQATELASSAVERWLSGRNDLNRTVRYNASENKVTVELRGFDAPPDQATLEQDIRKDFPDSKLLVEWIRAERVTTTTIPAIEPSELLRSEVEAATVEWLEQSDSEYQLDQVLLDGQGVRIDAAGTGDPPDLQELGKILEEIDPDLEPRLNWAERETVLPGADLAAPLELIRADMRKASERWAEENGYTVGGLTHNQSISELDISGSRSPSDYFDLETELQEIASDPDLQLRVFFTKRDAVTTVSRLRTTTTQTTPLDATTTTNSTPAATTTN